MAVKLSYRNYTNVTRHTTTTCQGYFLMASLTPTGYGRGNEGTSERANCLLLMMGYKPHPLILLWFTLCFLSLSRGVLDIGRFLYPPFGTKDNGRYSMVRIGMERILSFAVQGLGNHTNGLVV